LQPVKKPAKKPPTPKHPKTEPVVKNAKPEEKPTAAMRRDQETTKARPAMIRNDGRLGLHLTQRLERWCFDVRGRRVIARRRKLVRMLRAVRATRQRQKCRMCR
jgi:hypothetical protein